MPRLFFIRQCVLASLVFALVVPMPAKAQASGFPIPVPPSILTVPLLLLLIPLGLELSKTDVTRIRDFEARGDWGGVVALASRRLSEHPGSLRWHEIRGRALQRQGRCADAIPDLRLVFDTLLAQPEVPKQSSFDLGLVLGLCEMALWDFPSATMTMSRLKVLAPERWEPDYNLGVIRTLQTDVATVTPPADSTLRPMGDTRLVIGNRILVLPPGNWFQVPSSQHTVRGSQIRWATSMVTDTTIITAPAFSMDKEGRLAAAVVFSANPKQSFGTSWWVVDKPCDEDGALYIERFRSPLDRPECLTVRIVDPAAALTSTHLRSALLAAQAASAKLPAASYEVHYVRYGLDWTVAASWLLPVQRVPGDLVIIQWAHALANGLRPMASEPADQVVPAPLMGPLH